MYPQVQKEKRVMDIQGMPFVQMEEDRMDIEDDGSTSDHTFHVPAMTLGPSNNCNITAVTIKGQRDHQEDHCGAYTFTAPYTHLYLFVVCDGHGGARCSTYTIEHYVQEVKKQLYKSEDTGDYGPVLAKALQEVVRTWDDCCFGHGVRDMIVDDRSKADIFKSIDLHEYESNGLDSGTTLTSIIYNAKTRRVDMCNLGDSRSVVYRPEQKHMTSTFDHGVGKETTGRKGPFTYWISADGRLCGDLAMSSAIGDNTPLLTAVVDRTPDLYHDTIPSDEAATIILASDGFWDEYTTCECFLNERMHASEFISDYGGASVFMDNTTVIMIKVDPKV
jgi:serine/threonine protein phosphatase PrpC